MKKGKKIEIIIFLITILALIVCGIAIGFNVNFDNIKIKASSLGNKYNDTQAKNAKLAASAEIQETEEDFVDHDLDVFDYAPTAVTYTVKTESGRELDPSVIVPVESGERMNITISIRNDCKVGASCKPEGIVARNIRIRIYGINSLEDPLVDSNLVYKKDGINVNPQSTYETGPMNITITRNYYKILVVGENCGGRESGFYQFNIIDSSADLGLVSVEHNLEENPKGYVYPGDTIQGEVSIYSSKTINTTGEPMSANDQNTLYEYMRSNYYRTGTRNGKPYGYWIDEGVEFNQHYRIDQLYRRYQPLEVTITVTSGHTISNIKYTDSTGSYTGTSSRVKITQTGNTITLLIYSLNAKEQGVLTFDCTIGSGGITKCDIDSKAKLRSQWAFVNRNGTAITTWKDFYTADRRGNYSLYGKEVSDNIKYEVSLTNIKVEAKPAYSADGSSTIKEGEEFIFEYVITNLGGPAVNVQVEAPIASSVALLQSEAEMRLGAITARKSLQYRLLNGTLVLDFALLNKGEVVTVKIHVRSEILSKDQFEIPLNGQVKVTAKATREYSTNVEETVIERNEGLQLTDEQRERLDEAEALCAATGDIELAVRDELKGGGMWYETDASQTKQFYCLQPGLYTHSVHDPGFNTRDEIFQWAQETSSAACGCASSISHLGYESGTYFICENKHYTEASSYYNDVRGISRSDLYDIGFLASWTARWTSQFASEYSPEKQQAFWMSVMRELGSDCKGDVIGRAEGTKLLKIATNYRKYWKDILKKDEANGINEGIKPESVYKYRRSSEASGDTNTRTLIIRADQEYTLVRIGPFKLNYVDCDFETDGDKYSFGGISDMYFLDNEENRINIVNIAKDTLNGVGGKTYKVDYPKSEDEGGSTFFSIYAPDQKGNPDPNKMDWYDGVKTYPKPGEEFYVDITTQYDYNRDGVIDDKDVIPSVLKLKVEFQYMRSIASICKRRGEWYRVEEDHNDTPHTHPGPDDTEIECHDCMRTGYYSTHTDHQRVAFILKHDRNIFKESLIIPLYYDYADIPDSTIKPPPDAPEPGEPDSDDNVGTPVIPYFDTTMKIGGFVFQDALQGKESDWSGDRQEGTDIPLANVKVELYDAYTNELAYLRTLEQERPAVRTNGKLVDPGASEEEINDPDDYTRRTNPTLTDQEGYYEFRGVEVGRSYYVKFTYNGQTYTTTDYMKDADIERLITDQDSNYGADPEWQKDSKGTEKDSERDAFDYRFSSIGSSPNNYPSTNSLDISTEGITLPTDEKDGQTYYFNETYSIDDLSGIKLNSEGLYEYDENHQLIDSFLEVVDGYIVDHSEIADEQGFVKDDANADATPGLITKAIRNYIMNKDIDGNDLSGSYTNEEHLYPTDDIMKEFIYKQIVDKASGGDQKLVEEYWKKLQFIEDSQISSYTKGVGLEELEVLSENEVGYKTFNYDVYPYNPHYSLVIESGPEYPNNSYSNTSTDYENATYKDVGNVYPDISVLVNGSFAEVGDLIDRVYQGRISRPVEGENLGEIKYMNVYPGQLFINQGLIKRPQVDVALKKDVYKATLTINGKTEIYEYNEREITNQQSEYEYEGGEKLTGTEQEILNELEKRHGRNSDEYLDYKTKIENKFWDIQARILGNADYYYDMLYNRNKYATSASDDKEHYYDKKYNRELYESDFKYADENEENQLHAYVTYKLTIRNQSQSVLTQIDEIVDYYDADYEYKPEYSWVMYKTYNGENNKNIKVKDQEFYDIMTNPAGIESADRSRYKPIVSEGFDVEHGRYAENTQNNLETEGGQEYKKMYIDGLKGKRLASGESAYVYLTFQVNGSGSSLAIDSPEPIDISSLTDPGKQNIAEINGYTTYYASGTVLPNGISVRDDGDETTDDIPVMYRMTDEGEKVYRETAYAGLIDRDSNPGNFTSDDLNNVEGNKKYEQNFEDDADRARGIRIFIQKGPIERIISGTVWEDKRDVKVNDALVGDGIRDEGEVGVGNIQVELYEIKLDEEGKTSAQENGDLETKGEGATQIYTEGSWKKALTTTDENGHYEFKGFIPGDYFVRFTYGGNNNAEYNGQDYKSTTYQLDIDQNGRTDISKEEDPGYVGYTNYGNYDDDKGQNSSGSYGYDIYKADNNKTGNVSDAKDIWWRRNEIINYSINSPESQPSDGDNAGVTYPLANTLSQNKTPNDNTVMRAETGAIRVEFEYNRESSLPNTTAETDANAGNAEQQSNNQYKGTENYRDPESKQMDYGVEEGQTDKTSNNDEKNYFNGTYHIKNLDFGLEERPKAGLELNKQVSHIVLTLADGSILFDDVQTAENLIWQPKTAYNINDMKDKTDPGLDTVAQKVEEGKENVYSDYRKYDDFRKRVLERVNTAVSGERGVIQASMDEEIMHGSTIQITYDITVTNIGEVDYRDTQFYYSGKVADESTIVKTSAVRVMDYVSNNLQFRDASNDEAWGWEPITNGEITGTQYVSPEVANELKDFNTIIITGALNKKLIPRTQSTMESEDTSTFIRLTLAQLITSQNTTDDLSYGNIAEIVKIHNDVGRRMAFSVQGNQSPSGGPAEPDSSRAEQVTILPPFGKQQYYLGLGIAVISMLAVGIIAIITLVLKKKE